MMSLAIETRNRPAEKWRKLQRGSTAMLPSAITGRSAAATQRLGVGRATTSRVAARSTVKTAPMPRPRCSPATGSTMKPAANEPTMAPSVLTE